MAALNYPPHITLAVYDDIHPDQLEAALTASFAGVSALRLTFTRLRFFDDAPLVLWADPAYSPAHPRSRTHTREYMPALILPRAAHITGRALGSRIARSEPGSWRNEGLKL